MNQVRENLYPVLLTFFFLFKSYQIFRKDAYCSENYFLVPEFFCTTFCFLNVVYFVYKRCVTDQSGAIGYISKTKMSHKEKLKNQKIIVRLMHIFPANLATFELFILVGDTPDVSP